MKLCNWKIFWKVLFIITNQSYKKMNPETNKARPISNLFSTFCETFQKRNRPPARHRLVMIILHFTQI